MERYFAALAAITVCLISVSGVAKAADLIWPQDAAPRQLKMTRDSAPGWRPTPSQIAEIHAVTDDYFAAKDNGQPSVAYGLLADMNKQDQTLQRFSEATLNFNEVAGPVKARQIVKVTWTKDPPRAPAPGVYVALDDVGRFANIDRYCGFVILYQPPSGGSFKVMREESNFLDNATALKIEQQRSRAEVETMWGQLSAHCPK